MSIIFAIRKNKTSNRYLLIIYFLKQEHEPQTYCMWHNVLLPKQYRTVREKVRDIQSTLLGRDQVIGSRSASFYFIPSLLNQIWGRELYCFVTKTFSLRDVTNTSVCYINTNSLYSFSQIFIGMCNVPKIQLFKLSLIKSFALTNFVEEYDNLDSHFNFFLY